jgi:hypothetical protein
VPGEKLQSVSVGPTAADSVWGVDEFGQIRHFDFRQNRFVTVPLLDAPAGVVRAPIGSVAAGQDDGALVLFSDIPNIIP